MKRAFLSLCLVVGLLVAPLPAWGQQQEPNPKETWVIGPGTLAQLTVQVSECPACPVCPSCDPNEVDACADGLDNDCDGFVDCGDDDCADDPACATCVPVAEVCDDGVDNNCDGFVDCADASCAEDPACVVSGPPENGLVAHFKHTQTHAVERGVIPVQTVCGMGNGNGCTTPVGGDTHHLHDTRVNPQLVRQCTELNPTYWPGGGPDGAVQFREVDQCLFLTCTSLDPPQCEDRSIYVPGGTPFGVSFVGVIYTGGKIFGATSGGVAQTYVDTSGHNLRIRMGGSGRVTVWTEHEYGRREAFFIERQLNGKSFRAWARIPCQSWQEVTPPNVTATLSKGEFGCIACYYPNQTQSGGEEYAVDMDLLDNMWYLDHNPESGRTDLFAYIDDSYGSWIDQGCSP